MSEESLEVAVAEEEPEGIAEEEEEGGEEQEEEKKSDSEEEAPKEEPEKPEEDEEGEAKPTEEAEAKAEPEEAAAPSKPKKLTNQFNYCERAALTYNLPTRVRKFYVMTLYLSSCYQKALKF